MYIIFLNLPAILKALSKAEKRLNDKNFNEKADNLKNASSGQEVSNALYDLFM